MNRENILNQGLILLKQICAENALTVEIIHAADKIYDVLIKIRWNRSDALIGVEVLSSGLPRFLLEFAGATKLINASIYPVLIAPYISPKGAQILKAHKIGYCDLAGNCYVAFKNVLISKTGLANPLPARKEARSLFAPRASRLTRVFLSDPLSGWLLKDLSQELKMSVGYIHSVVTKLLQQDYLMKQGKKLYVKDREGLLSAWASSYHFTMNANSEFYFSKSLDEFEKAIEQYCSNLQIRYALTLFSGARYRAPFVRYPRLHAYFDGDIERLAKELDLKPVATGANIVILTPYDEGVFYKSQRIQDRNIVSDIQLYLDLQSAKGRAEEQASALAFQHLHYLFKGPTMGT